MRKNLFGAFVATAALLSITACGSGDPLSSDSAPGDGGSSSSKIIVGSADFPESQLIGKIYAEALRADGIEVQEKMSLGSREVTIPALKDGSVDLMPEYSGALLQYFKPDTTATSSDEVAKELANELPEGLKLLDMSAAEDKDVLTVKPETAQKYNLTKISDLKPVAGELVLGGPPEWKTRVNGVAGLKSVYGLEFKSFSSLDAGGPLTLNALLNNQIQVADLFSTDPAIAANNLVPLEDDKDLFLAENIVPLINESKATDDVAKTLNEVSSKLTTDDLIEMNGRVAKFEDIGVIANEWLAGQGMK